MLSNLREVMEQLEQIEREIEQGIERGESYLRVQVSHAYHHLNFAWNARRATYGQYNKLTDERYNRWSKLPRDIDISRVPVKRRRARKAPQPKTP